MRAVAFPASVHWIHPDGCRTSGAHALKQRGALTEVPIGGCLDGIPAMLQFTRPFYSCVWPVRFFLWGNILRTDF